MKEFVLHKLQKRSALLMGLLMANMAFGEAMVQYFNTDYAELTRKMPELAEVGYTSMWLPPPKKASGGLSVGYDCWDRFDLGSKDQRGGVATRYGTEEELLRLIETAHRFGIRVYFDNIMNHNAFDIPGFDENTPIDIYPGMVPEDFHLRTTEDGFYRKWDNTRDWNDAWQVQHLGLSDLIDIAHETPNGNFGPSEGSTHPKYVGVRQPDNPEYYVDLDLPVATDFFGGDVHTFANKEPFEDVGCTGCDPSAAGNGRFDWVDSNGNGQHDVGETSEPFTDTGLEPSRPGWDNANFGYGDGVYNMGNPVAEDVGGFLIRSVRWFMDRTKADGLRLDAVKHVPDYFFGEFGVDASGLGYLGGAQVQYNISRGFSDWSNHRDTVFDTEKARDDAMMFGEHLGQPPGYDGYWAAGMRLIDNDLRTYLNGNLAFGSLSGFDNPGAGGFDPNTAVLHAQSHDSDFVTKKHLQHGIYFTRAGLPLIYTDGNYHAETLGDSGGAFPRHANTTFLGQFGDRNIPNAVYLHEQFARGNQVGKWSTDDYAAWERHDNREGHFGSEAVTMLFMVNKNGSSGVGYSGATDFPADAYLKNYSYIGGDFSIRADQLNTVIIPADGYFAFSYHLPEMTLALQDAFNASPITILQNGEETGFMSYERRDGPDGDPGFNPYGVVDNDPTDYKYTWYVPRVTDGSDLSFVGRANGSAANIMFRLDSGIDINDWSHPLGDPRDNPPALSTDVFLGYENVSSTNSNHKLRLAEKFAAADVSRNVQGSPGSESFEKTVGSGSPVVNNAIATVNTLGVTWVYHDPNGTAPDAGNMYEELGNGNIELWVKVGYSADLYHSVHLYYTTDNASYPEGSVGKGANNTKSIPFSWHSNGTPDGGGTPDWWRVEVPASEVPNGTQFRYKIGVADHTGAWFPGDAASVEVINRMETIYTMPNIDATSLEIRPHTDYSKAKVGLEEGFHMVWTRAFLERATGPKPGVSMYNTFKQTFYYDTMTPTGIVKFAEEWDTIGGNEYEFVVRTDATVEQVLFNIQDSDSANDDINTGGINGNGTGSNGVAWVEAYPVTPSLNIDEPDFPLEWRFRYRNIPSNGTAQIKVRLLELSSSTNMTLTPAQGHFTELVRNVNTDGPDLRVWFNWPTASGQEVEKDWLQRIGFSTELGNGLNDDQLRDSFSLVFRRLGDSSTSAQPKTLFTIDRFAGTLETSFEAMYSDAIYNADDPNQLYEIILTQTDQFNVERMATTIVRAIPLPPAPFIDITDPEEVDVIGNRQDIEVGSLPATNQTVTVASDTNALSVWVEVNGSPLTLLSSTNVGPERIEWTFVWDILTTGQKQIIARMDTDGNTGTVEATDINTINVVRFIFYPANGSDADDDEDGILDIDEINAGLRLETNPETWINSQVHDEWAFGRTKELSPDSDNDGLPDGLELGFRWPRSNDTDTAETFVDAFGFTVNNFIADLDPPFYNTLGSEYGAEPWSNLGRVPGSTSASQGGDRRGRLEGTTTDPNNPDSDGDGIPDGIEDWNRNGWVDGDGEPIPTNFDPWLERNWPDGVLSASDTWLETDPNNADTDGDGLSDGFEDGDKNGWIFGDSNSNRVYDAGEAWGETNPLDADTDDDGLPDGWEAQYQLNALDNGIDDMGTSTANDGNTENGASGNPDGDAFDNLTEFNNGTSPRFADTGSVVNAEAIFIGAGPVIGTINGVDYYQEFQDWKLDDLLVLDEYHGDGGNYRGDDVYPSWDEWDSSRDIVAFYFRDGGDENMGGTGEFYFRVDFMDLKPFAEEGQMDLYVVVDIGSPSGPASAGEQALPDDIDGKTAMQWEALIHVKDSNDGRIYLDEDKSKATTTINEDLASGGGVTVRDGLVDNGLKNVYFNADLDAVEFSIDRKALTDAAGWNGLDAADLNFQVFTTKEGTCNSCNGGEAGSGDIGGRNDFRDTIYDDKLTDHFWREQTYIAETLQHTLQGYFGKNAANDRGKRSKVAILSHGNQHVQPGSETHALINDGVGAGYHRLPLAHEVFDAKVNLHITPTLASSLQWAKVDPAAGKPWLDGPTLNQQIGALAASNTISLLGSTFSDHILPFFPDAFNADNILLANTFLTDVYGVPPSDKILWPPERVVGSNVFTTITGAGYSHAIVDQMRHTLKWFGRTTALGDDGYRINRVSGLELFQINDFASGFFYSPTDNGLNYSLRSLMSRKARSGEQAQVLTLFTRWEELQDGTKADIYDQNIRWLANREWIELVTLHDVAAGNIDLSEPPDGAGDFFGYVDRGSGSTLPLVAHDWLDHATQEDYSNWYFGSPIEEGLSNNQFEIRPGVNTPIGFGLVGAGGMVHDAWTKVNSIVNPDLKKLARAVIHASLFQTAFHEESNNDLRKFSTGEYIYPSTEPANLIGFAEVAQAQARFAAIYQRVDTWAETPPTTTMTATEDVDQDGENEYLVYNETLFALFEALGGRLTGLWVREGSRVYQLIGNHVSYAGNSTEYEGNFNVNPDGSVEAHRTSAFKDWYGENGTGGISYVNDMYGVSSIAGGWRFTSSDGNIVKEITLPNSASELTANYTLSGGITTLYIRNGFSPNLWDLLLNGQENLDTLSFDGSNVELMNLLENENSVSRIGLGTGMTFNSGAVDDDPGQGVAFDTVNMRNLAQTHQVEISGSGNFSFTLGGEALTEEPDTDGDGIPDAYEDTYPFLDKTNPADANLDEDGDGVSNLGEYIAGTSPDDAVSFPMINLIERNNAFSLDFPTVEGRNYYIMYHNGSLPPSNTVWTMANPTPLSGTGNMQTWMDDGSLTSPHPTNNTLRHRVYRLKIELQ